VKIKIDRIISLATLAASVVAIVLVLKRPAPVARPQTPAAIAEHAQSFDQKMSQLQQAPQNSQSVPPPQPDQTSASEQSAASEPQPNQTAATSSVSPSSYSASPKPEVHITSDEIGAMLAQTLGTAGGAGGQLTPDTNVGSGAPVIKDQQVSLDGDVVHGQFLTEIGGKDVWITVSGHLGEKDGYATFDPTEFKVGDLSIPVSLVNPALQKKLSEQRDRLKLPDYVGGMKVDNSQLVMQQK